MRLLPIALALLMAGPALALPTPDASVPRLEVPGLILDNPIAPELEAKATDAEVGAVGVLEGVLTLRTADPQVIAPSGFVRVRVPWTVDLTVEQAVYAHLSLVVRATQGIRPLGSATVERTWSQGPVHDGGDLELLFPLHEIQAQHGISLAIAARYDGWGGQGMAQGAATLTAVGPVQVATGRVQTSQVMDVARLDVAMATGLAAFPVATPSTVLTTGGVQYRLPYAFHRDAVPDAMYASDYASLQIKAVGTAGRLLGQADVWWNVAKSCQGMEPPCAIEALDVQGAAVAGVLPTNITLPRQDVSITMSAHWSEYVCQQGWSCTSRQGSVETTTYGVLYAPPGRVAVDDALAALLGVL